MSFVSSFKINKFSLFPALTAPFTCFTVSVTLFFSIFFFTFEVKLLTNPGKLSPGKGIAIIVNAFFFQIT